MRYQFSSLYRFWPFDNYKRKKNFWSQEQMNMREKDGGIREKHEIQQKTDLGSNS